MHSIEFRLPGSKVTAGRVLQHASGVIEFFIQKHYPLTFKIGYTHDPCWRWGNRMYGYCHAKEKWSNMCVLCISDEQYGPAMLEAALIDKFKSTFDAMYLQNLTVYNCFLIWGGYIYI